MVKEMTAELLQIYAARQKLAGKAFPPDDLWQKELEATFPYDETPDQLKAVEDEEIRKIIRRQEEIGLKLATDGAALMAGTTQTVAVAAVTPDGQLVFAVADWHWNDACC